MQGTNQFELLLKANNAKHTTHTVGIQTKVSTHKYDENCIVLNHGLKKEDCKPNTANYYRYFKGNWQVASLLKCSFIQHYCFRCR